MRQPLRRRVSGEALASEEPLLRPHAPSLVQGLFYLATGLWPLVDIRSFQRVTGPKTDLWLVKTVGGLIAVTGGVLASAGLRGRMNAETTGLALGSAAFLAAVDLNYVGKRRISRVYLLDAAAELGLIALWAATPWAAAPPRKP